ncbi:PREDICTED: uncharacterized protein LOC109176581 [Ipomoea nil]|uniref:uncharacterized protein LOC109176581 n=1 Tax=Ipomoea nil TaxID=35883 RepID=UPI000900D902|nr:PREDICTED: uncharacterized protein LOC109176581 [Ipomoea nil]
MEEYARKGERYGGGSEEEKLELRLGPPDGGWSRGREESSSLLSFGYLSNGGKRGFMECVNGGSQAPHKFSSFLQLSSQGHQGMGVTVRPQAQESSQPGCNKGVEVQSCSEKKAPANTTPTAVPNNTSQKRVVLGRL